MRILITGGAGYLGSVITPHLLNNGHEVTVIDNLMYRQNSLLSVCRKSGFQFVLGDARDETLLKKLIPAHDAIIPLAALVGANACQRDPKTAIELNFEAVKNIMKLKDSNQIVIYPNTNSGYGINVNEEYCTEESPLNPISLYGRTKVDAEKEILATSNFIILRLATVFGVSPRMRLDLLVNDFVYRAKFDSVIVLFEEHFRRNFIHIDDIAYTFNYCIENFDLLKNNVFNVGLSEANLTKRQLAEKIIAFVPELTIISSQIGQDPDKRDYLVSNKKLENTGWFPKKSLDDGIKELLKVYSMLQLHSMKNI